MIDLPDLLEWLGSPTGVDSLLVALEARAVDIVERETERHFGTSETFTEILQGTGRTTLWLNEAPSAVTSVEYRTYVGEDWTTITASADDGYELQDPTSDSGGARLLRKGGFLWTRGYDFRVIYDFGYAAGSEPPEIRQAVIDLVTAKYRQRERQGLKSETIGEYSYTTDSMGTGDIASVPGLKRALSRWRRSTRELA